MFVRLLPLLIAGTACAVPASTTLQLVEGEDGVNALTLRVDPDTPIPLPDSDTADLVGSVTVDLDLDPATGKVRELTVREGRADASDLDLGRSFLGFGYNVSASNLSAAIATTNPPGTVEEATGDFDASQHGFVIDRGTISGSALGEPVSITLSPAEPFVGVGSGTGNITLTPTTATDLYQSFDVVVTLPISIDDNFDASTITVGIEANGTLKAIGSIDVPKSDYLAWTIDENIAGADGQADTNGDGVPNAIAWALGLGALDDARAHILKPANGGFDLQLPTGGTLAPITIEGSDLHSPWLPINPNRLTNPQNPLPPGSSGFIRIRRVDGEFLRLSAPD